MVDEAATRSYGGFVHLRRAVLQAVIAALFAAGWWSWSFHLGSVGNYFIVAAILFPPLLGFRLIVSVGGALLDDERARNRRAGVDRNDW